MKKALFFSMFVIICIILKLTTGTACATDPVPGDATGDGRIGLDDVVYDLQILSGTRGWQCQDDDETNGIYRVCNYFPLNAGNRWIYTTGDYTVVNMRKTCSSGYSGIKYGSTTYTFEPILQNSEYGLMMPGCQYKRPDESLIEWGSPLVFVKPEMHIGETFNFQFPILGSSGSITLKSRESVTVPSGTYNALKFEASITDTGSDPCSYKTTLWMVKNVGMVKFHRTDPNPPSCGGCLFVCRPDKQFYGTPAELISAEVNGIKY